MYQVATEILGWMANLIQIGAFLFTIAVLWRTRQRLKRYLEGQKSSTTANPIALAVGIGENIEGHVRRFAETATPPLKLHTYYRTGNLSSLEFYTVLGDLLEIRQQFTDLGVTEVHLFYRGPVTLAAGIGAIFDNWVPVKLYGFRNGAYELDFSLAKGTVLGLLRKSISEGEEAVAQQLAG
jgi:hypothetical protein